MEINEVFYSRNYWYITSNKFFKVISISKTGKTFKVIELEPKRYYDDAPYNTRGDEEPTDIPMMTRECSGNLTCRTYNGRFSKSGNPFINYNGDKKCLDLWDGVLLDFDHNS